MICFEVSINGKKLCLAGLESGVLATYLTAWQAPLEDSPAAGDRESIVHLEVNGCRNSQHFRWTQPGEITMEVGDEVTIKIVESATPDAGTPHDRKAEAQKPKAGVVSKVWRSVVEEFVYGKSWAGRDR